MVNLLDIKNISLKKLITSAHFALDEKGVVIIRNLFKPELINKININWSIYFKNPSAAGSLGYSQTSHKKLTLNPFLLGDCVLDISLNKVIINIIETYMKSSCTLAEANALLDKSSSYEYFPLHSDFAEGWKKSSNMKKALTKKDLRDPIGVGAILYLHDTSHGCFTYAIGSHKLLSPYGQSIKSYPVDYKTKVQNSIKKINGLAGDIILFDDRGFHGPDQPSKADRRVLIFDYYRDKTFGSVIVKPHKVKINDLGKLSKKQMQVLGINASHLIESHDYVFTRFKKNFFYPLIVLLIKYSYFFQHVKKIIKSKILKKN